MTYTNQNDWGTGFTGNVSITNNSPSPISGWILAWVFPGNQIVTDSWNGVFTQSGQSVSVANLSYNATIAANGGSVNFGFNASYSGVNASPGAFWLNGVACQAP